MTRENVASHLQKYRQYVNSLHHRTPANMTQPASSQHLLGQHSHTVAPANNTGILSRGLSNLGLLCPTLPQPVAMSQPSAPSPLDFMPASLAMQGLVAQLNAFLPTITARGEATVPLGGVRGAMGITPLPHRISAASAVTVSLASLLNAAGGPQLLASLIAPNPGAHPAAVGARVAGVVPAVRQVVGNRLPLSQCLPALSNAMASSSILASLATRSLAHN
jgi:hypothetical protein